MNSRHVSSLLFAAVLSLPGCGRPSGEAELISGPAGPVVCSKSQVGYGGGFTVTMPAGHGPYLAIINPKKQMFFVHLPLAPGAAGEARNSISNFEADTSIGLWTELTTGWTAEYPGALRKVFDRPGKYTVVVGHNLETEDMLIDGRCTIEYAR